MEGRGRGGSGVEVEWDRGEGDRVVVGGLEGRWGAWGGGARRQWEG